MANLANFDWVWRGREQETLSRDAFQRGPSQRREHRKGVFRQRTEQAGDTTLVECRLQKTT